MAGVSLLDQVRSLHDAGLMSSVNILASFMLSLAEKNVQDRHDIGHMTSKYQMLLFYANSLYDDEQYRRAEHYYRRALQIRKAIIKNKTKASATVGLVPEAELRYKLYQCYMNLKEIREAKDILEGLSQKQRSPKVNMALGKLYQRTGMERSAVSCYKEVLRVCPLALEAAAGLLALGATSSDVTSLITAQAAGSAGMEWLSPWIKGHAFCAAGKHAKAAQIFKTLEVQQLRDNANLLCVTGETYWNAGDQSNARAAFNRAHTLDFYALRGMDIYAQLLEQESSCKELEKLSKDLIQITQIKPEPWVAMAHFCNMTNRKPRAVYFAQKAHTIDSQNVQALVLKASLLQSLDKQQESLLHFREAVKLAPGNFEAQKGLVECYLAATRYREALAVAKNSQKTLGVNARTLTLLASAMRDDAYEKSKTILEKALAQDPGYTEAVCLLAEITSVRKQQQEYEKITTLLRKHLLLHRTPRVHQLLGDFLTMTGNYQEALDQYTKAVSLNPGFTKALKGIENVKKLDGGGAELDSGDDADEMENSNVDRLSIDDEDIEDSDTWTPGELPIRGPLF